ncbi:MAG: chromosome partitioning protein [Bacteriovoracaceae bacterium]|jgi:chromosome partitioning protein
MFNFLSQKNGSQSLEESGKIIALMNQKGGVGKTTMAYNVAHALKSKGKKVLCIDMDPQFNFSLLFGFHPNDHSKNIYHLLVNSIKELKSFHTDTLVSDVLIKTDKGIDILPAGQELSGFELTIAGINAPRQLVLKKFIEKNQLNERYDYIVIDGPPTLGLLVVNILCACNGVLFPFIPDSFSEQGLKNIRNVLLDIEDMGIVQTPKILGYIPNLFEGRRKKSREDFEHIRDEFTDGEIFPPFLNRANFAKSMASKKSVFDYEASDFKELQGQFLDVVNSVEVQLGN